jgi:hypothetical protein
MPTTLVVGHLRDLAGDVLEVVRDWTATGLMRPSLWLDTDQTEGGATLAVVDRDGLHRHPAEQWLARSGITLDRVVLLQVFAEGRPAVPLPVKARALLDQVGLSNRPLLNLLVPATVDTSVPPEAVVSSRPNVLLQARDGQSPATVSQPVPVADLAQHAAAGLAAVAGLWTPMEAAPFDGTPVWPGRQVVVVRAYARTLDSGEVLAGLSDQVHRAEGTLPHPRSPRGDQLTEVPDVQALPTAEAAAGSLVEAHASLTRFHAPPAYVPGRATGVKFLAAIGMFLSFLWSALRSSPRTWAEALVRRTAGRIASGTTNLLYGSDSAYEVVVLGVRPGGRPAEPSDEDDVSALIDTAHRVATEVSPGTEFTTVDAMALWSDMTTVAVSLADGSDVPPQVRMPMLGVDRQVVDRPELIAPSPAAAAHGLPVGALPGVRALSVDADDPYLALQAHRLLTQERDRPGPGTDDAARYSVLESARTSLGQWVDRQRCYTWRVGYELALQLDAARETLAEAVRSESLDPAVPPRDILDTQSKTRRTLFGVLAAAIVGLAVVVGLVIGAVLSVLVGSLIGLALVVLWLVGSTAVFLRHQRKLFAWLHARDESARRRAWARQHAAHVAKEVHRLGVLYRQSRYWTRVLGAVVHDPFGVTGNAAEESAYPTTLSGSLPLSTAVGAATFSPEGHSELVHLARRAQLGVGWLGAQLQSRIQAALESRSQRFGRPEHRLVWSDTAYSEQGPLPTLVAGLGTEEDRRRAAHDADARLVDWLTTLGGERGLDWSLAAVHPKVAISAGALGGTVSGQQFLSPVLAPAHYLDPQGFSATGSAAQSNVVDRTALAAVGVPVPGGSFDQLRVRPGSGRQSMDRFVARLDISRQLMPDHVSHFAVEGPEPSLTRYAHGRGPGALPGGRQDEESGDEFTTEM